MNETNNLKRKSKALAYITRQSSQGFELLVHVHKDFPEAGVQVPAGTIDADETAEQACLREAFEESGIQNLQVASVLGDTEIIADWDNGNTHHRHFFHLIAPGSLPDNWSHKVTSGIADTGLIFNYFWLKLSQKIILEAKQHAKIGALLEILENEKR